MPRLFAVLPLCDAHLFFFVGLKQGLELQLFLFLLLSRPINPFFFVEMEGRPKGSSELYQTLPHLHFFVVLNRQVLGNFYDIFFVEGELCLTFDVGRLSIHCVETVEVLMLEDAA